MSNLHDWHNALFNDIQRRRREIVVLEAMLETLNKYEGLHKDADPEDPPGGLAGAGKADPEATADVEAMEAEIAGQAATIPACKKECTDPGCHSVTVAKGLCRKHYDQANPKSARTAKKKAPAASAEGRPSPKGRTLQVKEVRLPCEHPTCDQTYPYRGNGPKAHYCGDFCRNNHAILLQEEK